MKSGVERTAICLLKVKMLRTWWLDVSVYWTFVVVLVTVLVIRELLGALQDERSRKWMQVANFITIPLLAIFLFYVVAQIFTMISRLLWQS